MGPLEQLLDGFFFSLESLSSSDDISTAVFSHWSLPPSSVIDPILFLLVGGNEGVRVVRRKNKIQ